MYRRRILSGTGDDRPAVLSAQALYYPRWKRALKRCVAVPVLGAQLLLLSLIIVCLYSCWTWIYSQACTLKMSICTLKISICTLYVCLYSCWTWIYSQAIIAALEG